MPSRSILARGLASVCCLTLLAWTIPALGSGCPTSDTVGEFTVEFLGNTVNPDGTSSWEYQVTWSGVPPEPSNITFELPPCATLVGSSPEGAVIYSGPFGFYGLRWEFDDGDFEPGVPETFTYILDKPYDVETVRVAVKAGPGKTTLHVCGPNLDCELEEPLPVLDLQCTVSDVCKGSVELSWTNQQSDYDFIKIFVDGVFLKALPGNSTGTTIQVVPGLHEICVVTVVEFNGLEGDDDSESVQSTPVCCQVDVPEIPDLPPANLSCAADPSTCLVTLTWTNKSDYSQIDIFVNGVLAKTVGGNVETTTLTMPLTGLNEICLEATTICGKLLPQVCCTLECEIPPPPPVTNLQCEVTDICTCLVQLSWQNGASDYDAIEIRLNGTLVATLPGNAVAYSRNISPGTSEFCVLPIRDGVSGDHVCCTATCETIPATPPAELVCTVFSLPACQANLSWLNTSDYSLIKVYVNGVLNKVLPGGAQGTVVDLPAPGPYEICLEGETICGDPFPPVCCLVECPFPPAPVTDLSCELVDPCDCEVLVSWVNGEPDYDAIKIFLDNVLIVVLPGDATSLPILLPTNGTYTICVVPVRDDLLGLPSCCTVDCPEVPANPPANLVCTADRFDCMVTLTWENQAPYSEIEVYLNGVLLKTHPGDTETTTLPIPVVGMNQICLRATTICGDVTPDVCCDVDCTITPPLPILNLMCELLDPCTGEFTASWTNQEADYDEIRVLVDGVLVDLLPGAATSYSGILAGAGPHDICIVPVRNGATGDQACCNLVLPDLTPVPPIILFCEVSLPDCEATIAWVNEIPYGSIVVTLDGVPVLGLPGDAESATIPLPGPGTFEICLTGETICGDPFPPTCCPVDCPFPPEPVANLECTLVDPCACEVLVTWTNTEPDYDEIRILLNGDVVAVLNGDATSHALVIPGIDPQEICVVAVRNLKESPPVCCTVECPDIPATPPENLVCTLELPSCDTTVTWTNTSQYASIAVLVNGVLTQTLPGDAESTQLVFPDPGTYEICLEATTICGDVTPQVCCTVACPFPPLPVLDLQCVLTDVCTGEFLATWTNQEADYDEIRLLLNGNLIATLPGTATSATFNLPAPGARDLCVVPVRNLIEGEPSCCTVEWTPVPVIPPSGLMCMPETVGCSVTITWTNESEYAFIEVYLDGVLQETLPGDATSIVLPGRITGMHQVCLQGETICGDPFGPVCCDFDCEITPPLPVLGLICTITELCACEVLVTWTNQEDNYDEIQILVDGTLVQTLPGDATSTTLSVTTGEHVICVVPVRVGVSGLQTCCSVVCAEILATPPTGLVCEVGPPLDCETTVTWTNTSDYAEIRIFLDGILVETLPGNAQTAGVPLGASGTYEICIEATTICGDITPQICCTVECPFPPLRVLDLTCSVEDCSCEATLQWTNQENDYDEIRILLDGVEVQTLPGSATSTTLTLPAPGNYSACVIPVRNTLEGDAVCCSLECVEIPLLPPTNLQCQILERPSCDVIVTWTNQSQYAEIRILVDGVLILTLPGSSTEALFELPAGQGVQQICLEVTTICGDELMGPCCEVECVLDFVRGDCNIDAIVNVADAIYIMRFLFQGLPASTCLDACDFNDDGIVDVSDVVFLLHYIFLEGPPPGEPFPSCGFDETPDEVQCDLFGVCDD